MYYLSYFLANVVKREKRLASVWVFIVLFVCYNANLRYIPSDDATANTFLAQAIQKQRSVTFSPDCYPFMFVWALKNEGLPQIELETVGWSVDAETFPKSAAINSEALGLLRAQYYLSSTVTPGKYASTHGIGAGLFALPFYGFARLVCRSSSFDIQLIWSLAKIVASTAVAGSAVFVFVTLIRFCRLKNALCLTLAYGLGTCVWSISSQTLWQHGPTELFLTIGCYFILKDQPSKHDWLCCAFAWSLAALCRPTAILLCLIAFVWILTTRWRDVWYFVLGCLPIAVVISIYNYHFFGSFFKFGQTEQGRLIAFHKTGSSDLWQTPMWDGLTGVLFSPSRGLFVFSPVLLFGVLGAGLIWKERKHTNFRLLTLGVVGLICVGAKWFDWWGGWCYGYRQIVDVSPLLILLVAPVADQIFVRNVPRTMFYWLLTWSIAVQIIGAFGFTLASWNNYNRMDVDKLENRRRLWSMTDNQIYYCISHFEEGQSNPKMFGGLSK